MKNRSNRIRNFALWLLCLIAPAACRNDETAYPGSVKTRLRVSLEVEGIVSATRGQIPATGGEERVNSLHLFFFDYEPDGSGRHVATIEGSELGFPLLMEDSYEIPFAAHPELLPGGDYVILALANVDPSAYTGDLHTDGLTGRLGTLTERQLVAQARLFTGGAGTDQTDDTHAPASDNIPMSARVVRMSGDDHVVITLRRALVRFDIANDIAASHTLVSASVWGAAASTPLWNLGMTATPARMQRFYGLKASEGDFTNGITGGLYAFENFLETPAPGDTQITCIILGLRPVDGGETSYYRVDLLPAGESQSLVRNNVYRLRLTGIAGPGAEDEYGAWQQSESLLSVSIDTWELDENGLVITDGESTLVLPARVLRLTSVGGTWDYVIQAIGRGALSISKSTLPAGFTAGLDGTLLRITTPALGGTAIRRGSIELSFGALRGVISLVQSSEYDHTLELNRYEAPLYPGLGRSGPADKIPFSVNASGAWTATIYNTSADAANPGFSFTPSGDPQTTLRSGDNPLGNLFQVYTTGDNPSSTQVRYGFVMITLDVAPDRYNRVITLGQNPTNQAMYNDRTEEK